MQWAEPKCVGEAPAKRSGHSLSVVGTNAYVFGGCDQKLPPGPTNDLFVLRFTSGDYEWERRKVEGTAPMARYRHTATVFDATKILIFGGFKSGSNRFNDVHVLDTVSLSWLQPIDDNCTATPRGNHIPVDAKTAKDVPSPRGSHSACLLGEKLYIFGGYGGFGYKRQDFNDTYALDIKSWKWEKIQTRGKPPPPRSGHSACIVNHRIFVYGGWNCHDQFNDLWVLDTNGEGKLIFWGAYYRLDACQVIPYRLVLRFH